MKIGYKTRTLSTADFMDYFDPPLEFLLKGRATEGWLDLIEGITEARDTALARRVLEGICYNVSDGEQQATIGEFYDGLKREIPAMADEVFCDLAYALGIEFLRETRQRIAALKKTQMPANGTEPEPDPASASSDS